MKMTLQYDQASDVYVITCVDVRIDSVAAVQEWVDQVRGLLEPLGKKVYLALDIENLRLAPEMAPAYGPLAREILARYALGAVRFGNTETTTRSAIRAQARLNFFPSNIMPDRETAIAVLQKLRELSSQQ
jgi:hypothetical protein